MVLFLLLVDMLMVNDISACSTQLVPSTVTTEDMMKLVKISNPSSWRDTKSFANLLTTLQYIIDPKMMIPTCMQTRHKMTCLLNKKCRSVQLIFTFQPVPHLFLYQQRDYQKLPFFQLTMWTCNTCGLCMWSAICCNRCARDQVRC